MPECPLCGKDMRSDDHSFIDYESKQGASTMEGQFPVSIDVTMFENYVCSNCGTIIWEANHVVRYENPKIEKIKPKEADP